MGFPCLTVNLMWSDIPDLFFFFPLLSFLSLQEGHDPLMYTITRKSSSRRQSSNSTDSYDNNNVCSNNNMIQDSNVGNNDDHEHHHLDHHDPSSRPSGTSPLKRSSDTGIESMYLDDQVEALVHCAKSPALDLSCSPNRSRVVSWLNQSSDYLTAGSSKDALQGCGYLSPSSYSSASSRTASPGPCSSKEEFDQLSCSSLLLKYPSKASKNRAGVSNSHRHHKRPHKQHQDQQCHHRLDGMGYLTPPIMSSSSCCSPNAVQTNINNKSQKRCSSFSSSSSVSSTSSLFSSSMDDSSSMMNRGSRSSPGKKKTYLKDSTSSYNNNDEFSCLYLLASAAVSELERQRHHQQQTRQQQMTSSSVTSSSSCLQSSSYPQPSTSPSVSQSGVPFKKRNHIQHE